LEIATIGFTRSSAQYFFERLRDAGIGRLVDIRLHNRSQLSGFAKSRDLPFFLDQLCGATYERDDRLAPTAALLHAYRQRELNWFEYESSFLKLMAERAVPSVIDRQPYETLKTVLLCSEPKAGQCHRRLVAEILSQAWGARIEHL
jgi:uncharacterized protein (DUF488 family)